MVDEVYTKKKGRRVLSAPGEPKVVCTPHHAEAARKLVELGANDFEISQVLGVSPTTIINWRKRHPEFAEALHFRDEHGTFADDRVKRCLLHKATGYSYHSEKIFYDKDAGVVRVPVVEHVPPSDTAMIFYLKNRDPDRWNDQRQVDVRAPVRVARITENTSPTEAQALFRAVLDGAEIENEEPPSD